jgi:DNA-binding MarR family transcriptional regulator
MILSIQRSEIMLWLARYKYLCSDQIHEYLFSGKTKRNTEIMLERMEKKGLIKRAKLPKSNHLNFGYLCYLTPKGFELTVSENQLDNGDHGKYPVIKPMSSINHYYHRKCLVDFFIQLDLKIKKLSDIRLKTVLTEAGKKVLGNQKVIETKITGQDCSIIPDMIFVLQNTQTLKEAVFMVEIDTGKEAIGGHMEQIPIGSLLYKYQSYEKILESELWSAQLETTAEVFQVLTVTETSLHIKTISKRIKQSMNHPELFLGTTHLSAKMKCVFTNEIWLSPTKKELQSLLH